MAKKFDKVDKARMFFQQGIDELRKERDRAIHKKQMEIAMDMQSLIEWAEEEFMPRLRRMS